MAGAPTSTRRRASRMFGQQQPGRQAAEREAHQVTGLAPSSVQAVGQRRHQRIGVAPGRRRGRIAEARQIGRDHLAPGRHQRLNVAHPVRPAAAAAVEQHHRRQTRPGLAPDMPDRGARAAGRLAPRRLRAQALDEARHVRVKPWIDRDQTAMAASPAIASG
jgi:hypothetical protein